MNNLLQEKSLIDIEKDIASINKISIVPSLLEVVCRTTKMGFAAIARVTDDKWVACAVKDDISFGLKPGGELTLETTICNEIRESHQPVVIDHVEKDKKFIHHHTPAMYGFQSYISVPIMRRDGSFFGTLCAIDPQPAKLNNPETIGMFTLFADLISLHLATIEELSFTEKRLAEERHISELREQFIAVLGHDLRNPVSSITMGVELLESSDLSEENKTVTGVIKRSTSRITELINNTLDFAKGRLGGGIDVQYKPVQTLEETLKHIVDELRLQYPARELKADIHIGGTVTCDEQRIAQLLSNLLSNAISHSTAASPVNVAAYVNGTQFILTVSNQGSSLPESVMDNIFHPFYRENDKSGKNGLGLGLYIAAEIAKAHKGELTASCGEDKICFSLQMPAGN